jgi:hypothetical protein
MLEALAGVKVGLDQHPNESATSLGRPSWVFIIAPCNELRLSKVVGSRPFQNVESSHCFRLYPNALFHLLCCKALTPAARSYFWKIRKWTTVCLQVFYLIEYLATSGRDEACTNPGWVD